MSPFLQPPELRYILRAFALLRQGADSSVSVRTTPSAPDPDFTRAFAKSAEHVTVGILSVYGTTRS